MRLLINPSPNPVVVDRGIPTVPAFVDAEELEVVAGE